MTLFKPGAAIVAVTAAIAFAGAVQAAGTIPTPNNDPFYTPPAGYQSLANGTVVKSRTIDAEFLTPFLSTSVLRHFGDRAPIFAPYMDRLQNLKINAYQVLYKSSDRNNRPEAEAATILVPQGAWKSRGTIGGKRPLVAFQSAEDSVSTNCQPSYTLRAGLLAKKGGIGSVSQFDVVLSFPALLKGYAVVYADYEGPDSKWLAGKQAGHGVLDGIRAALHYAPDGLAHDAKIALWGYSGGGGATGWAAEQAQVYAPELNIVGAAIGANSNADLANVYASNNGTYTDGFLPMAIVGLKRAFPNAGIDEYVNARGRRLLARAADNHACTLQNLLRFAFAGKLEQYTVNPSQNLAQSRPAQVLFRGNSLVDQPLTPAMPILSYHDVFDTLVPVQGDNELARKYCRAGGEVEVVRTATPAPIHGLIHIVGAIKSELPALHYVTNRFKGISPRNDCYASWFWSLSLGFPYHPFDTR